MSRNIERTLAAILSWCRLHNVAIRYQSNGTVSVRCNNTTRRRATLIEAVEAVREAL